MNIPLLAGFDKLIGVRGLCVLRLRFAFQATDEYEFAQP